MKNLVLILSLAIAGHAVGMSKAPVRQSPAPMPRPAEADPRPVIPAQTPTEELQHGSSEPLASPSAGPDFAVQASGKFTTNVKHTNYTPKQAAKLATAAKLLATIINSQEYRQAVLDHRYGSRLAFDSSLGLSNAQVYEKIFRGAERLGPAVDYEMDLIVTMYRKSNSVVGWTNGKILIVNTNSKFHDKYTACQVAGNLLHEWMHKLGFDHKSASSSESVPYAQNRFVKRLCPLAEKGLLTAIK
jgi:hypothetical protein